MGRKKDEWVMQAIMLGILIVGLFQITNTFQQGSGNLTLNTTLDILKLVGIFALIHWVVTRDVKNTIILGFLSITLNVIISQVPPSPIWFFNFIWPIINAFIITYIAKELKMLKKPIWQ